MLVRLTLRCVAAVVCCSSLAGTMELGGRMIDTEGRPSVDRTVALRLRTGRGGAHVPLGRQASVVIKKLDALHGADDEGTATLVILRHGMSVWNRESR